MFDALEVFEGISGDGCLEIVSYADGFPLRRFRATALTRLFGYDLLIIAFALFNGRCVVNPILFAILALSPVRSGLRRKHNRSVVNLLDGNACDLAASDEHRLPRTSDNFPSQSDAVDAGRGPTAWAAAAAAPEDPSPTALALIFERDVSKREERVSTTPAF